MKDTMDTNRIELDLAIEELESMTGLGGHCGGNVDPDACDASLGGAISAATAFSVIAVT